MNIVKATKDYEAWLGQHTRIVASDLEIKHQEMADGLFSFLRATFYRWVQVWPEVCSEPDKAPRVLGVGDLHVENFGTWRDSDGRLVWGINDFDEADQYPYTMDLARLATSALVAAREDRLAMRPKVAVSAILDATWMACKRAAGRSFWPRIMPGFAKSPRANCATRCVSGRRWISFQPQKGTCRRVPVKRWS